MTSQLLAAAPHIDALWNHDDDQGVGVLAAIDAAGRDEILMVGGAGSKNAMDAIKADNTVLKATIIYPSTQGADGIRLARLVAQGKSMSDLVEIEVPNRIVLERAGRHQGERRQVTCRRRSSPKLAPPGYRAPVRSGARAVKRRAGTITPGASSMQGRPHQQKVRSCQVELPSSGWEWLDTGSWAPPIPRAGESLPGSSISRRSRP